MFYGNAAVIRQSSPAPGICRLVLHVPQVAAAARPGQFVNLYTEDKALLLPRPISICDADPEAGTLTLIYAIVGKGTEWFSHLGEGMNVRLAGPLGNGYPLEEADSPAVHEIYLVGGGLGVPPMLFLARRLHEMIQNKPIRIFNGFRSKPWIDEEFHPYGEVFNASDDGASGFMGNVIDAMEYRQVLADYDHYAVLFACGPVPMLRALQEWQTHYNLATWFSLEERMGCGFGACAGCPVTLRGEDGGVRRQKVCQDGPVFPGEEVIFG